MNLYFIVFMIILYILVIIDLYPLWNDFKLRYILKQSYITNSSLDKHFKYLDNIVIQSGDFEGHIGCSENKIKFIQNILNHYKIKNISEIGFNAGHSSSLFLSNSNTNKLVSFDLCQHIYSKKCIEYIKNTFNNKFILICGDSTKTIPQYNNHFDLIFIDGGHYGDIPYLDIQNTIDYLSNKNSLLLIDDTYYSYIISKVIKNNVDNAVNYFIKNNKIKLISSIPGLSLFMIL